MGTERYFMPGEIIVRREMLDGREWLVYPVRVVEDGPDLLAVYLAHGTPLTFGTGEFRWGVHPWANLDPTWQSEGVLQLQRPGDGYAVWLFWKNGKFSGWYVNFQEPLRRTPAGFDTLDHELDLWLPGDGGAWQWKDVDLFEERERSGVLHAYESVMVRAAAAKVAEMLASESEWWDSAWSRWSPPADWAVPQPVALS